MTPSEIDPATFQFVAQCLNHCATACPKYSYILKLKIKGKYRVFFGELKLSTCTLIYVALLRDTLMLHCSYVSQVIFKQIEIPL
jgi:hypothetical protein